MLAYLLPSGSLTFVPWEQRLMDIFRSCPSLDVALVKSLLFSLSQLSICKSGTRGSSLLPQPFVQREARLDINSGLITLTFFGCNMKAKIPSWKNSLSAPSEKPESPQ